MPYTSTRLVRRFEVANPKKVVNGAAASATVFSLIADGQQYLFGNDMPMMACFSGRGDSTKNSIQATGTTVKRFYGRVLVPPFASHCEFWFSCAADASYDDDTAPGYPIVTVISSGTGGETRSLLGLPVVGDSDATGTIYDFSNSDEAAMYATYWVGLFGMGAASVTQYDAQAVKLMTATTVWTEVPVEIQWQASSTANGKLTMNAAYYRVVAPTIYTL